MKCKEIFNHPALLYSAEIKEICKPLAKLGITYFSHVSVDKKGGFAGMSNNPAFHQHYLEKEYYNADVHLAKAELGSMIMWDNMPLTGRSALLYQESIAHGVNHTFSLIEKDDKATDCYHFATHLSSQFTNQIYLQNIDLLKIFILHFKDIIIKDKYLKKIYQIKFGINTRKSVYDLAPDAKYDVDRASFLKYYKMKQLNYIINGKKLTSREIEILAWLHYGKSCVEIAEILKLAEITVRKHIINIKTKTNTYSFFQLGELFANLFTTKDIIPKL